MNEEWIIDDFEMLTTALEDVDKDTAHKSKTQVRHRT